MQTGDTLSRREGRIERMRLRFGLYIIFLLTLSGCGAPWSLNWLSQRESYDELNRTVLSNDQPSDATLVVLRQHGLLDAWETNSASAIADLRKDVIVDPSKWSDLFSLAELSYLRGRKDHSQPDLLAAAVYAYAFLFPDDDGKDRPLAYDPRFRQACDIYNLALADTLAPLGGKAEVKFESKQYALPFGSLEMQVDQASLLSEGRPIDSFEPTYSLRVEGPNNIYHNAGLGAPLAAAPQKSANASIGLEIAPKLRIPANALLTIKSARQQLSQAQMHTNLTVHTIFDTQDVQIGNQTVPLQYDQTAARALSIVESAAWNSEYSGFLNGTLFDQSPHLVALEPHRPGRRPVILVHGTASSPFRWADMVNDLIEDPRISRNYEFWFFSYATGNPIPYSALQLRQAVQGAINQLGGPSADPALGKITLIGHSQGGLLAKMLVIDPGDALWNGISRRPFDQVKLSNTSRELIRQSLFAEAMPEIQRVIFIATPQRGSYVAAFSISQFLGRFVTLPSSIARAAGEFATGNSGNVLIDPSHSRLGSIYGMSPNSPFIKALANVPVAPGVHANSIIPVETDGPLSEGSDGVVRYDSAHISGVDSELVVHSGHSTQSNPFTIAEVSRILLQQLATGAASSPLALADGLQYPTNTDVAGR